MGKSEYFEVRKVEGEVEQPQIILDADAIYDLLLRAELMMTKVDRMRYANRAIEQILDVIREFMLAYDFEDDRRCFEANEGYKHNDILIRKYGFKFNKLKHKHNDKTRNRRQEEFPCLSHT